MKWISVDERLPENDGRREHLACYSFKTSDGLIKRWCEIFWHDYDAWLPVNPNLTEFIKITHWMPIELPKESASDVR